MTNRRVALLRTAIVVICLLPPVTAAAQNRSGLAAEFQAGWVGFADDGIVSETLVGGAARWYPLPRIAIGPEIVYIGGTHHSHLVVTGNMTWDIRRQGNGHTVIPFLVIGGGLFQTRETFFSGP